MQCNGELNQRFLRKGRVGKVKWQPKRTVPYLNFRLQDSLSSRKLTRDEARQAPVDPQASSAKHGAIRVKEEVVDENSLLRRDGTPPKSLSSPILEKTLLRALTVWRVSHDKGCPQKEGYYVTSVINTEKT